MNVEPQISADATQDVVQQSNIEKHTFPTFTDLAAIFGVFVILQISGYFLSQILVKYFGVALSTEESTAWIMLLTQLFSMSLLIVFILVLRKSRKAPKIKIQFSVYGFNPTVLLGGIAMMLSATIALEPLLALMPDVPPITSGLPVLIAAVIGAPIFEELVCRGLIYESVRTKKGVIAGWLISSLFFGLMHLHPTAVVNAFFMGLILSYIYIRSRSLFAPIILHAFNNGLAYIFVLFGWGDNVMLRDLIPNQIIYYIIYSLAIVILIVSTMVCARQFKKIAARVNAIEAENIDPQEEILQ